MAQNSTSPASILVSFVRERLARRPDSEHEQALIRIVIVSMIFGYFHTGYFASDLSATSLQTSRFLAGLSLVVSITLFGAIVAWPLESVIRRLTGILHDMTAISGAIYFGEGAGAVIAILYFWVTVGNGFRYGTAYLYVSAATSTACFALVYYLSEFWRGHPLLTLNILLMLLVVPVYIASLLKSLNAAREELHRQATTDSLTGLLNRKSMEQAVDALFRAGSREHVLLFCDLDLFKQVNDNGGHAAGDQLLADIGGIVQGSVRKGDLCGRLGGDEFCVVLRDCGLAQGRNIAEKLRASVSAYRLDWESERYGVGISIGVAPANAVTDSESLFNLADTACYAAKNHGRNRVHVIDSPGKPEEPPPMMPGIRPLAP